jgi:hypothetical protein
MSEKLLQFLMLSEMSTVRLICKNPDCGAVFELPIGKLIEQKWRNCLSCKAEFDVVKTETKNFVGDVSWSALEKLSDSIQLLSRSKTVAIEFVMDAKNPCALTSKLSTQP